MQTLKGVWDFFQIRCLSDLPVQDCRWALPFPF